MDLQLFIEKRPYLYHLTSKANFANIVREKKLYSANELIKLSEEKEHIKVKTQKRDNHYPILVNGTEILLRDQRPISLKALSKCLTDGWSAGDFLMHLNERVFMWPTLDRLWRHYNRYAHESPMILRFSTEHVFAVNKHPKFCRLNSGATRANSYLGGKPPERGANSFVTASKFDLPIRDVAEVTFEKYCLLPEEFHVGNAPDGVFRKV